MDWETVIRQGQRILLNSKLYCWWIKECRDYGLRLLLRSLGPSMFRSGQSRRPITEQHYRTCREQALEMYEGRRLMPIFWRTAQNPHEQPQQQLYPQQQQEKNGNTVPQPNPAVVAAFEQDLFQTLTVLRPQYDLGL